MKKTVFLFLLAWSGWLNGGDTHPDFAVTAILAQEGSFITIKLENLNTSNYPINPALKEKIFLTIYLNGITRAEYKLKYLDPALFHGKSAILFQTNFPIPTGNQDITIKAHINRLKIIPENNISNNTLEKKLGSHDK